MKADADHRADQRQRQPEQHGDAEAVDQPRDDVPALVVGAEPMRRRGRRRERHAQILADGGVAEGDRRPEHPALGGDRLAHEGIAVVSLGLEIATEGGLGIGAQDRGVQGAVETHQQRPVVGDQLGAERDREQGDEDPQRPPAAAVAAEILQPPSVERRQTAGEAHARPAKSMRGSTSV
jgi:hypothetical protein